MGIDISDIQASFGRVTTKGDFFGRFYDIFLASNPAIGPRFVNTDLEAQKKLLRQGVNLAIMFAAGNTIGVSGIGRIRDSHQKGRLDIPPALYPYWLDSFIKAMAEMDSQWTPALEKQWRDALQKVINFIIEGYDQQAGAA